MGDDRARKKKVRALMAVTGQGFTRAARDLDAGEPAFMRTGWGTSAWARLLPREAMDLELVIATASVFDHDGELAQLIAASPNSGSFPRGVDTGLTWWGPDETDSGVAELREHAQATFAAAVTASGKAVPTTVADLADLLAALGVYHHTRTERGRSRWRVVPELPDIRDVLPLPQDWIDSEDNIRWIARIAGPALALRRALLVHRGCDQVDTTLQRLAAEADLSVRDVRAGLDGLLYRFPVVVVRHGTSLDRRSLATLPEHARISLVVDWASTEFAADTGDAAGDHIQVNWPSAPWHAYRMVAAQDVPDKTRELVGYLPFGLGSTGATTSTFLAALAAEQRTTVEATVESLIELEVAGLVRWDAEAQRAEMAAGPHRFTVT